MVNILIIEDEKITNDLLSFKLNQKGYKTVQCYNGFDGLGVALANEFSLIITDVVMPELNGLDLIKRIRNAGNNTPIVILSAQNEEMDQINGFKLDIEDYYMKPFNVDLVCTKIEKLLKRIYTISDKTIVKPIERTVIINGQIFELTRKEFMLFEILFNNNSQWISKEEIYKVIWNQETDDEDKLRSVDFTVKRLRQKLDIYRDYIQTKRRVGYKYEE